MDWPLHLAAEWCERKLLPSTCDLQKPTKEKQRMSGMPSEWPSHQHAAKQMDEAPNVPHTYKTETISDVKRRTLRSPQDS